MQIKGSVGRGGANRREDIMVVQQLLEGCVWHLVPLKPVKPTGVMDAETQNAIDAFQRKVVGQARPTGLVEPLGRTLELLNQKCDSRSLNNSTSKLNEALAAFKSEAANFGSRFIRDGKVRQGYIQETEKTAKLILEEVKSGRLSPAEAAEEANKLRNSIMEATRLRSSDIGRAQAEALKQTGLSLQALEEKYALKLFKRSFEKLSQAEKNQVWLQIVESSGRARPAMNAKAAKLAKAGKALIFLSVAISVYNVATAEDKGRQVVKEGVTTGAGVLGGMGGGALAGLACGPGAPVCVTIGVFVGGAAAALGTDFAFDWLW